MSYEQTSRRPGTAGLGQPTTATYHPHLPLPAAPAGVPPAPNQGLDELLEQVAATLQLTPTQFEDAKTAYGAVTDWLGADESLLAPFAPRMFPQGSAALLTTTRPVRRNDYDVDLVCELVRRTGWTAMQLYDAVWARLWAHGTYRPMLERKNRCIRLNYAREFHLDIVPAEPAPMPALPQGELAVRIPDRTVADWTSSNPRGYARWFHVQAETRRLAKAAREIAPLPPRQTVAQNTVLATVVQLIKRHRDLAFADPAREDLAPRSVILTTLAAEAYDGEQSTARALHAVATGMAGRVRAAWPNRVAVSNPTNPAERFCDKFTPESYTAFVGFVLELEAAVAALAAVHGGLPDYRPRLDTLFGAEPVQKAFVEYGAAFRSAAGDGRLRASGASGLTVVSAATASGRAVPSHRFFGV